MDYTAPMVATTSGEISPDQPELRAPSSGGRTQDAFGATLLACPGDTPTSGVDGAFSTRLLGPHHSQHPQMLFEQLPDFPGVALGLRGLSSYYHGGTASQEEKRTPPSQARRGALTLVLRALLRLETAEIGLAVVHEAHRVGDRAVARLFGD